MGPFVSPAAWARRSAAHPWRVIGAWGVVVALSVVLIGALLSGVLSSDETFVNSPESMKAQDAMVRCLEANPGKVARTTA